MGAQLVSTVYVQDPDSRQTVTLDAGTLPEPRLAALVTNPAAWVDGKLPRLPKTAKTETESPNGPEGEGSGPSGAGPGDASGDDSATTSDDADHTSDEPKATTATKTAAKETAAKTPARGRTAAAEGTGGQ
jgi:hypothetical protein